MENVSEVNVTVSDVVRFAGLVTADELKLAERAVSLSQNRLDVFYEKFAPIDLDIFAQLLVAGNKVAKKSGMRAYGIRASEMRQLYGAFKYCSHRAKDIGWHQAIRGARKALAAAKIKWNGQPFDRQKRKAIDLVAMSMQEAANEAIERGINDPVEMQKFMLKRIGSINEKLDLKEAEREADKLLSEFGAERAKHIAHVLLELLEEKAA